MKTKWNDLERINKAEGCCFLFLKSVKVSVREIIIKDLAGEGHCNSRFCGVAAAQVSYVPGWFRENKMGYVKRCKFGVAYPEK